jgi:hypothetical protein
MPLSAAGCRPRLSLCLALIAAAALFGATFLGTASVRSGSTAELPAAAAQASTHDTVRRAAAKTAPVDPREKQVITSVVPGDPVKQQATNSLLVRATSINIE